MKLFKTTLLTSVLALCACNQDSQATAKPEPAKEIKSVQNAPAQNSDPNHQADIAKALQDNLNKSGIDVQVSSVVPTAMPELFWATIDGASPVFTDKTGKYLIDGTVVAIGGEKPVDISAQIRANSAKTALSAVDKSTMISFTAKDPKASIYVFTDPTCGYCQQLHKEMADINAKGITVHYLAWPRGDKPLPLSEAVWCSDDKKDAITRAKKGENITAPACNNPVKDHVALGYSLGVSGTPAIFAQNGVQLGGYLPADELAKSAIANQ